MWDKMFPGKLEKILASMNEKPDFTVRVNTLKMSVDEFISQRERYLVSKERKLNKVIYGNLSLDEIKSLYCNEQ